MSNVDKNGSVRTNYDSELKWARSLDRSKWDTIMNAQHPPRTDTRIVRRPAFSFSDSKNTIKSTFPPKKKSGPDTTFAFMHNERKNIYSRYE